jgi:hypothetical protein
MENSPLVLLRPGALTPSGGQTVLALGRELVARVASVAADGTLFLKVGNGLVAARSEEQLTPGDVLRLQVSEAGADRVVLKLVQTEQPPARSGPPAELKAPVRFEVPLAELQPLLDELDAAPEAQAGSGRAATRPAAPPTGAVVQGRVVPDEQGRLLVRLPSGGRLQLPAELQRSLTPGQTVDVAVEQPRPGTPTATVELRPLAQPIDQRAALVRTLTSQLAPQLGEEKAAVIAEFVAARGVSTGDAPLLAARLLAQQLSPVELLRRVAGDRPKARALLHSIEQELASGDPDRVRTALSRLGLDQEKRLAQAELTEPSTLKSTSGPEGETAVSAQQLLLLKPGSSPIAPVFLFLPLPDGGEARLVVDDSSQAERSDGRFALRGELDLARTGTVSFHLLTVEGGAFMQVESPDGAVVQHLRAELRPLVTALERGLGIPVSATVTQSAAETPSPIPLTFEKTDLYA